MTAGFFLEWRFPSLSLLSGESPPRSPVRHRSFESRAILFLETNMARRVTITARIHAAPEYDVYTESMCTIPFSGLLFFLCCPWFFVSSRRGDLN